MLKRLFTLRRRPALREPTRLVDPRSGVPVRRGPEPMPRIRWY
jgi:hypothetical protein